MSAFQVAPAHIGAIVRWYLCECQDHHRNHWRGCQPNRNDAESMMVALADENARSVNYRYSNHDAEAPVPIDDRLSRYKRLTTVQVIKACDCLDYQSCEHPTWEQSDAYRLLQDIKNAAIAALPGYDTAEWAIDDEAPRPVHATIKEVR